MNTQVGMNAIEALHNEELRHHHVMREWNARERDRKEWAWEQRLVEDERRETDRIIHERHMARWAPAYHVWGYIKWTVGLGSFLALFWFALLLADVGGKVQKIECLKDVVACEASVKGGSK